jgi:hypothetical protein
MESFLLFGLVFDWFPFLLIFLLFSTGVPSVCRGLSRQLIDAIQKIG